MSDDIQNRRKQRRLIFIFFFLSGAIAASWSSRLPDIQHKLRLNNAAFGMVLSSLYAGLFSGLAIASWLIASYGSKKIMITTCVISAILLVVAGLVSSAFLLVIVLFLMGFARTIFNLSANTGAIEVQTLYQRPIVAGFHGVWSMACFIAGSIGTVMIILGSGTFLHFSVVALLILITVILVNGKRSDLVITKTRRPFFVKPDQYLFLLGLMALSVMLCEGAMFDWSVIYFEKVIHAKRALITTGYLSFIMAMAFGRLVGDRLIAEFGMFRMLVVNGVLLILGFAIAASFPLILPAACGFLFIGLGDSVLVPVIYMLASKSNKMSAAYSLSIVTFIGYLGFLIGPLFIGNVSQYYGLPVTFYCLSGVAVMLIILSLRVKKISVA